VYKYSIHYSGDYLKPNTPNGPKPNGAKPNTLNGVNENVVTDEDAAEDAEFPLALVA
jgi:hypothetical protein